jgi:hypothetical protein
VSIGARVDLGSGVGDERKGGRATYKRAQEEWHAFHGHLSRII